LGLTNYPGGSLANFKAAVAPKALDYNQWGSSGFLNPVPTRFSDAFAQAIDKAKTIYVNLAGILPNLLDAIKRGRLGYNMGFSNQSTNYTNYELFTLSLKVGSHAVDPSGTSIESKIKWYDGTTPIAEPTDFGNLWNSHLYP